jgi:hypothetical protein
MKGLRMPVQWLAQSNASFKFPREGRSLAGTRRGGSLSYPTQVPSAREPEAESEAQERGA